MSDRPDPVVSVILESNYGGIPVTICACAALLVVGPSAWLHIDHCPAVHSTKPRWRKHRE